MKELAFGRGATCRYVARVLLTQGILHQRTPAIEPNDLGLEHLLQVLKENMQLNQKHIFKSNKHGNICFWQKNRPPSIYQHLSLKNQHNNNRRWTWNIFKWHHVTNRKLPFKGRKILIVATSIYGPCDPFPEKTSRCTSGVWPACWGGCGCTWRCVWGVLGRDRQWFYM